MSKPNLGNCAIFHPTAVFSPRATPLGASFLPTTRKAAGHRFFSQRGPRETHVPRTRTTNTSSRNSMPLGAGTAPWLSLGSCSEGVVFFFGPEATSPRTWDNDPNQGGLCHVVLQVVKRGLGARIAGARKGWMLNCFRMFLPAGLFLLFLFPGSIAKGSSSKSGFKLHLPTSDANFSRVTSPANFSCQLRLLTFRELCHLPTSHANFLIVTSSHVNFSCVISLS